MVVARLSILFVSSSFYPNLVFFLLFADDGYPCPRLADHPSFKYVLMLEGDPHNSSNQVQLNLNLLEGPVHSSIPNTNPQVNLAFIEDNVRIVDPQLLSGVTTFEQLYLIGKILGDTLPLKLVTSKCVTEWKTTGDLSL